MAEPLPVVAEPLPVVAEPLPVVSSDVGPDDMVSPGVVEAVAVGSEPEGSVGSSGVLAHAVSEPATRRASVALVSFFIRVPALPCR